MSDNKTTRRTIIVTAVCVVYLLVTAFYHHIDKYLTGIVFIILTLLIPTTFIALFIYAIKGIIQIVRNKQNLTFKFCLPTIIALTTFLYTTFSPWQLNSEDLESKVEMRACYEGTQNQSYIKFRGDKSFEINATGVFFADFWYIGQWRKNGDTIFMKFNKEKPRLVSDTIILRNEYLIPITEINFVDSTKHYFGHYYLGYCKHEN
jgi:hypothetical protein